MKIKKLTLKEIQLTRLKLSQSGIPLPLWKSTFKPPFSVLSDLEPNDLKNIEFNNKRVDKWISTKYSNVHSDFVYPYYINQEIYFIDYLSPFLSFDNKKFSKFIFKKDAKLIIFLKNKSYINLYNHFSKKIPRKYLKNLNFQTINIEEIARLNHAFYFYQTYLIKFWNCPNSKGEKILFISYCDYINSINNLKNQLWNQSCWAIQQAIEKLLKFILSIFGEKETNEHNLNTLICNVNKLGFNIQTDLNLTDLHPNIRYSSKQIEMKKCVQYVLLYPKIIHQLILNFENLLERKIMNESVFLNKKLILIAKKDISPEQTIAVNNIIHCQFQKLSCSGNSGNSIIKYQLPNSIHHITIQNEKYLIIGDLYFLKQSTKPNCKMFVTPNYDKVIIKALTNINKDDELTFDGVIYSIYSI